MRDTVAEAYFVRGKSWGVVPSTSSRQACRRRLNKEPAITPDYDFRGQACGAIYKDNPAHPSFVNTTEGKQVAGLNFSHDQAGVMATETEGVAHRDIDLRLASCQGYKIHLEITLFILILQIDGGGDDRFVNHFYTYD